MKKGIIGMLLCICAGMISAQVKKDVIDYGESGIQWRVIATEGPVAAFVKTPAFIWYSTGALVAKYDLKTNNKSTFTKLGDMSGAGIKAIADEGGAIWFGGDNGVAVNRADKYTVYTKANGLCDNAVTAVHVVGGSVWVGTANGVSQFSAGNWTVYTTSNGLSGNSIRGISSDSKGAVWFATDKGVSVFSGGQWKKYDSKGGLSSDDVKAITVDQRKNEVWIAAGAQDINSYDGKSWNTYIDIYGGIICIMGDSQSRIWFGAPTGIIKFNGIEWVTEPEKIGFPAAQVTQMFKDKNGDLFFALENGILHMKNPYPF